MIRGVSFTIPQETTNTLWKIFNCIDIKKYVWYCIEDQSEIWTSPQGNEFFEKNIYAGEKFMSYIQRDHYIVFLKVQAYRTVSNPINIHTYEEFEKSDCELLLLIYDCEFVEIFSKNTEISKELYRNALLCGYADALYITDSNDRRVKLDII